MAHKIYGQALTINCANFVYFLALKELQALDEQMRVVDNIERNSMVSVYTGKPHRVLVHTKRIPTHNTH